MQDPQRDDRLGHGRRRAAPHAREGPRLLARPRASATTRSRRASRRSRRSARPTASRSTRPRTRPQFTDANLAQYDVVVFLSTTGDVLNDAQQTAFEHYIAGGRRLRRHPRRDRHRVHVALVRPDARRLLPQPPGRHADRDGQDRGRQRALDDRASRPLARASTSGTTSSRRPTPWSTAAATTTARATAACTSSMTVDESTYDEDDGNTTDDDHPVTWCTDFDGGRAWYTALGHTQASFSEPDFRAHILGGLKTAARHRHRRLRRAAPGAAEPRTTSRSRTIDDDTKSPMELAVAKDGRVFYVERITGEVKVIKADGTVVTAGAIPVSSVQENGLLGIALDPNFATNNNFYVAYTPLPDSSTETRIARFTLNGDTLDLSSEKVIFEMQQPAHGVLPLLRLAGLRPGRQPLPVDGRQHEPVRLGRLQPDRRAPRPRVLGRPAHVGQHELLQRQDPAHHAAREPDRRRASARATRSRRATSSTRPRTRPTRPCPRSSRWASAIRSGSRSTRTPARC